MTRIEWRGPRGLDSWHMWLGLQGAGEGQSAGEGGHQGEGWPLSVSLRKRGPLTSCPPTWGSQQPASMCVGVLGEGIRSGQPGEGTSEWSLRGEFWHSVGQVGERQSGVAPPSQFWGQGLPPLAQRPGCRGPSLGWVTGSLFSREPTHQLSMVNGLVPIGLPWVLHNRGLCTIQADPVQLPPWCG